MISRRIQDDVYDFLQALLVQFHVVFSDDQGSFSIHYFQIQIFLNQAKKILISL